MVNQVVKNDLTEDSNCVLIFNLFVLSTNLFSPITDHVYIQYDVIVSLTEFNKNQNKIYDIYMTLG